MDHQFSGIHHTSGGGVGAVDHYIRQGCPRNYLWETQNWEAKIKSEAQEVVK